MTTRTRIALGLGVAGLLAGTGMAVQSWAADQPLQINAEVVKFCQMNSASFGSLSNMNVISSNTMSSQLAVITPTTSTGTLNSAGFNFNAAAVCNSPSKLILTTQGGGLKDGSPETVLSGTFTQRIDYNALGLWNGVGVTSLTTNGTAGQNAQSSTTASAHAGNLQVVFSLLPSANPMLAGTYTDTLTITLEPQ